jgi:hypothetical protein
MAVYHIVGDEVVTDLAARSRLGGALIASDEDGAITQFEAIGIGRPLTIEIRHVYTGRFPKSGGLFGGDKDVALVSGVKDYSVFAASARALNLISRSVKARAHLRGSAFEDGTPIVLYSPAVMADSLTLSIEFAVDRFPGEFVQQVGRSLKALAGVPLMLPFSGYLMGAGEVARIAGDLGDALFDGRPSFSITEAINFDRPGATIATADFRILSHDPLLAGHHRFKDGIGLVDASGAPYQGDEPYVVISLDGKARPHLESFAASIASAAVLERFFAVKSGGTASIDTLMESIRLASDMRLRNQAEALKRQIDALPPGKERDRLLLQRESALKNIQSPDLRPPVTAAAPQSDEEDGLATAGAPTAADGDLDLDDDTHRGGGQVVETDLRVPQKNTPFGVNKKVKVNKRDGLVVFEGDIVLAKAGQPRSRGSAIMGAQFRWPNGVMIWEADADIIDIAQAAMRHWTERTGVRFKRRTDEEDYVHFKRLGASWSFVGRQGGMQELSLSDAAKLGTAVHEIGHALGLWHEQSRGDRDRHVTIRLDLVSPENRHNFDKHIEDGIDIGEYDFGSIMHYSARAFSTTGEPTIVTFNGQPIGQRDGLSRGDIAAVAHIYPETVGRA